MNDSSYLYREPQLPEQPRPRPIPLAPGVRLHLDYGQMMLECCLHMARLVRIEALDQPMWFTSTYHCDQCSRDISVDWATSQGPRTWHNDVCLGSVEMTGEPID